MKPEIEKILPQARSSFFYRRMVFPYLGFGWHYHPEYEITLILNGRGKRFVGDSIGEFRDGDLVFVGQNLPHTWYTGARTTRHSAFETVVVQFRNDFLGEEFFNRPEMTRVASLLRAASRGIHFTGKVQRAAAVRLMEMAKLDGLNRLLAMIEVLDLFSRAMRGRDARLLCSRSYAPVLNERQQSRIDVACAYVNENFLNGVSQTRAARIAHMSPSAFSRVFRRTTGKAFARYVNELRVGHACGLLVESDLTAAEICFASGFRTVANFNRRFLELQGTRPMAYRQQFVSEH